jgi:glutathione S-transferase
MKLYDSKGAPNPRRVTVFLAEKGIEIPRQEVTIAKGEHRQPEYLKINPLGTLPTLVLDDGTILSESVAICRYVEEQIQPQPNLFGATPLERAQVDMWNRRMEYELFFPMAQHFRNTHHFFKGRIPQSQEYGELSAKLAANRMKWLDGELAGRPFIAGKRYTIADITAQTAFDFFGKIMKTLPGDDLPNLARWYADVSGRPSAKAGY